MRIILAILLSLASFVSNANEINNSVINTGVIHKMNSGETLWDLSQQHYGTSYKWERITKLDGSAVEDVYRIPIGYPVLINPPSNYIPCKNTPDECTPYELNEDSTSVITKTHHKIKNDPSLHHSAYTNDPYANSKSDKNNNIKVKRKSGLTLYKDYGLVRAYWNDEYVMIPAQYLIDEYRKQNPSIETISLGSGLYIDKSIINKLFNPSKR